MATTETEISVGDTVRVRESYYHQLRGKLYVVTEVDADGDIWFIADWGFGAQPYCIAFKHLDVVAS